MRGVEWAEEDDEDEDEDERKGEEAKSGVAMKGESSDETGEGVANWRTSLTGLAGKRTRRSEGDEEEAYMVRAMESRASQPSQAVYIHPCLI
jgi:hypothetical protein